MKDIQYLTHDLGARNDPKLMDLQMDMGGQGLGIFWCLVELLWENGGYIPANFKSIAFALRWCKPAEVEKVVTGYDLFQVEDGMITSRSARERIDAMRDKFVRASNARRASATARWNREQSGSNANAMQTQCETNANEMRAVCEPYATNKLTNKHTNKLNNNINNIPPTADSIFEIFFFKNLKDPSGEVTRFLKHYEERGWTYQDGTPVESWEQAARDWKPAKAGTRFDNEALNWYKAVWQAAKDRVINSWVIFFEQLSGIRRKESKLALVYTTETAARSVASFIQENDLAGDYIIDFRVSN